MDKTQNQQNAQQEQDVKQLLKVRREKLAALQEAGRDPFLITKFDVTHHSQEIKDSFDELEGKQVSIAGRVMSKRVMGKASFAMCRICKAIFSPMWQKTVSGKRHTPILRNMMWVIL